MTLALIMSGGGARGAYEVSVLSYLYSELAERHGPPPVDLICGTSVGAINGAFLAATLHDPTPGLAQLRKLWRELTLANDRGQRRRELGRALLRLIDVGEGAQAADLASYLLFDGGFASELISLGPRDAAARHDELRGFLYGTVPDPGDNR